jgi:hypothetical protein
MSNESCPFSRRGHLYVVLYSGRIAFRGGDMGAGADERACSFACVCRRRSAVPVLFWPSHTCMTCTVLTVCVHARFVFGDPSLNHETRQKTFHF